jgi:hypothetical protein
VFDVVFEGVVITGFVTLIGSKPPVIVVTVVVTGAHAGPLMHAPWVKRFVPVDVAVTVVGTTVLVRFQFVALPVSVRVFETVVCSPVTAVSLLSVAVEAMTGPPEARLTALSVTVPEPASIVPGVSVLASTMLIPPVAVAVTAPTKSLLALVSVMAPVPAWRFVVPDTTTGPVWEMLPLVVSVRLPAVLVASCVDELSVMTTEPVVFTATVPKLAVPCVNDIAPPPLAVNEALPPTLSTSVA